jgi:amidase
MKPFALDEIAIAQLRTGIASGRFTALSLVKRYLTRIEQIDRHGPRLNSVIELNPDALEIAKALDDGYKARGPRGPLHGVPILIKDNLDTHDRMHTTAGSLALAESVPPRDAFVVQKLRDAGAVILGKTNLSEWANFRSSHSTSGWSARGGQTRNPYALDRNPSGSSSGSAVAVAANLCSVAVGTETDGSILSPSSFNGIVGLKPTVGLVSRAGIIPIAHSQDTAGPMARTVADVAVLLGCLAGPDPRDAATAPAAERACHDYTQFLDPKALRGARLGVVREFFGFHDEVDKAMESVLTEIRSCGGVVIDPVPFPSRGKLSGPELEVLLYEFKADLNAYLASLGPNTPRRTLRAVIDFNIRNRDREMPYFGQDLFLKAEAKGPLSEQLYLDALAACRRLARDDGIDAAMDRYGLAALIAPTAGPAHVTDLVLGDHSLGDSTTPAAVAGYPSITVPAGQVHGLPIGLSFFGRAWSEPKLISLAFAFEQATKARKPPSFLATAELAH